jgi:beta-glucosidase
MSKSLFPKDFLWGASTASHQVEGNTNNQWSEWEQANSKKLANNARKHLEFLNRYGHNLKWDAIAINASQPENYISGRGVEHYERYKEDFTILKSLNMNAYRFGIEWSRIEPQEGHWDNEAIAHYHRYIEELKALNIEPMLTIWHWTMPTWFTKKGGFTKKQNLMYFYDYVAKVADEFSKDVRYILILNEPNVYTLMSYITGTWPPQDKNIIVALRVYANLASAHKKAFSIIKATKPDAKVGIAMSLSQSYAISFRNPINRLMVQIKDYIWNWWFLNRIHNNLDFIGVNFYTTEHYTWRLKVKNPNEPVNDLGNYMEPGALYELLLNTTHRYSLPIIVTENGLADASDTYREWWLEQTLVAIKKALAAKVPLEGYLHWSLLDNFEWAFGWWPKFGLVEINRSTMKRTIRPSAKWFAEEIKHLSSSNPRKS